MPLTVSSRIYRFGPFEVAVEAAELRKNGVHLKLQEQPFQILCALLEHPGEIVTREHLRQHLWPDGTFVDFEHGLNTAIKKIRDVLNDDANTPCYIETIPRKGYRFIAPLIHDPVQNAAAIAPPASQTRWKFHTPILIIAVVIVMLSTFFIIQRLSQPARLQISATRQLTLNGFASPYPTIETDGRRVYYFKGDDGHLYSVPVEGGAESSYATGVVRPMMLHISPDGSTLLVKEDTGPSGGTAARIWLQPTNGGPARPLGDIEADFAAWSPDGKAIAFSQESALYVTEDDSTTYHRLLDAPGHVSWIRWSPDGQRLRFTVTDSKTVVSSIWEASRDGKGGAAAIKLGRAVNSCCGIWTRDGRYFLFREFRDGRTEYWVARENWSPFRSGNPSPLNSGGVVTLAATASPIENTLFTVSDQGVGLTFKYDLASHKLTPFLPEMSVQVPDFSPDGKWMAICEVTALQSILWRARSDGTESLQLTDPKLYVDFARYSRDGKRIAVTAKRPDQPWKIYWFPADGGVLHELNVPITSQADPTWMPDNESMLLGQTPLYFSEPDSPRAMYIYNLQTESLTKVPGSEGWFSPRLSPDGRYLLALSIDEHPLGLYDFATSQWRVLLENLREKVGAPFWSPDGKWAYVNFYGKKGIVLRIRIPGGVPEKFLSLGEMIVGPACWGWNTAPDGSIMISCYRPTSNIYALRYE